MRLPVYLDYMATTPVDPRVLKVMLPYLSLRGDFGNAASRSHVYGWRAEEAIEKARLQLAHLVQAESQEIIWTSGATEANNLAIKGAARFYQRKGKHIVTSQTEHKAVLDVCQALTREGFTITYLQPQTNGLINLEELNNALRDDTILVSIMHVNNELGVIQDIQKIGEITRPRGILLHVDAAQSLGKVPIDLSEMAVDLMSFSGHKIYAPKGIGALFVRQQPRVRLEPLFQGGGHELGLRAGTLPTAQIVAMGEACHLAQEEMEDENERLFALREQLWEGLNDLPDVQVNGDLRARIAGNLNVSFWGIAPDLLLPALSDLAISTGSACDSALSEPSHVLRAIGLPDELARATIRFSLGRFTTEEEVDFAIKAIKEAMSKLLYI